MQSPVWVDTLSVVTSVLQVAWVPSEYNVTVADNHGGTAVQVVTVTLTGTNDAPVAQAIAIATSATGPAVTLTASYTDLDLIEISPNAVPPVAKISDYGKYKYEAQKKAHEARKHQKVIEVKEIKMRPNIDEHDYEVKMRAMKRFIEEGDKVKVTLRFRGREMVHSERGLQVLNRVRSEMDPLTKIESMPRMEGRQMIMVLAPK